MLSRGGAMLLVELLEFGFIASCRFQFSCYRWIHREAICYSDFCRRFFFCFLFEIMDVSKHNNIARDMEVLEVHSVSVGSSTASKRKRSTYSDVWNHFEKNKIVEGEKRTCFCKNCKKQYFWGDNYGTSNLRRHVLKCPLISAKNMKGTQREIFNQKKYRDLMTKAIIRHNLPFNFVQYESIREIHSYLNNEVEHFSRNTSRSDVIELYENEKVKLKSFLNSCSGRVSITSDLWTSINTDGYITLTAHFIDNEWNLQKKLLNFCLMPPPHSGSAIFEKISSLLLSWGIVDKIFSCTLDNASANDKFVELLESHLNYRKSLVADGQFLHVRCVAHILNLIVQDGLKCITSCLCNIRESIKYIKGSQSRKKTFVECISSYSLDNTKKVLRQDVPTRWNSTFTMLKSAIYYEPALYRLNLIDSSYTYCPSIEEWEKARKIARFLEVFYDATCLFSGTNYPTANLFFPKIFMVHYTLKKTMESDDFMSSMSNNMLRKFNKYWSKFNVFLSIACIFDPRYKINFVKFSYERLYGNSIEFEIVKERLEQLFNEYTKRLEKEPPNEHTDATESSHFMGPCSQDCKNMMEEFDSYQNSYVVNNSRKSELDLYLDDGLVDRKIQFDILSFWKSHEYQYPILSLMAKDILAVPVTTVASESAFSIGGRVLDDYRSSLKEDVVEALLCSRDWLYGTPITSTMEDLMEDVSNFHSQEEPTVQFSTPALDD